MYRFCIHFINSLVEEPGLEGASSTATLIIQRDAGSFTEVTVEWEVITSDAGRDISPTSGNVTFSERQTTGTFTISALGDEVMAYLSRLGSHLALLFPLSFLDS